jgi:magnesium transporter
MTTCTHLVGEKGYHAIDELPGEELLTAETTGAVWIDSTDRNSEIEAFLRDRLAVHPLVIEDIFGDRTTPKVEDYGSFVYIVMHGVRRDAQCPESLETIELDIVLGSNWVFTHHSLPTRSVEGLIEELQRNPRVLLRGSAYVVHALLDHLTDHYLPVVDRFDDEIDEIEKSVVEEPSPAMLRKLFLMKRSLQKLRRLSTYHRDLLQRLARGEFELIPDKALPFFRDVYDHFVRIADLADSYREMVTAALEIYMSVTANRTNDIMKVLAMISTIMLPLTFIAGLYGMNFEHIPEFKWTYGYPYALSLMAVVSLALCYFFRRRKWI